VEEKERVRPGDAPDEGQNRLRSEDDEVEAHSLDVERIRPDRNEDDEGGRDRVRLGD
jgi:hypothetical protein